MIIPVKIRNRHAEAGAAGVFIVCGNSDDFVRFDFDDEWAQYPQKTACFVSESPNGCVTAEVPFAGEICPLPAVPHAELLCIGVKADGLCTTTAARIPCAEAITDCDAQTYHALPDVYNRLNLLLAQL